MAGVKRLDVDRTRFRAAARAARNLREQLERLLRGAEVREVQDRVGREHSDRRDVAKVVTLGDHLRPDEAERAARQEVVHNRFDASAPGGVAVEDRPRHVGKELGESVRDALGAGADRFEQRASALRAAFRARAPLAAVVTDEPPSPVVDRARHAAVRAAEVEAAVAAEKVGREAPPGLQKDCLLPPAEHLPQAFDEGRREERHPLLLRERLLAPEVDDLDSGQRPRLDAGRERQESHAADPRRVVRLHRRGGGAHHERRGVGLRPDRCDLARVVPRALALLVRGVVFLVDDEKAGIRDRRESGGSRTDDDAGLPRADAIPRPRALPFRERGVQDRRPIGELAAQLAGEDGSQSDFGDEPDGAPPEVERGGDRAQVDLRLPAAGDSLEKGGQVAPLADRPEDRVEGPRLFRREDEIGRRRRERRRELALVPAVGLLERREHALRGEGSQHGGSGSGRGADFRRRRRTAERVEPVGDSAASPASPEQRVLFGAVEPTGQVGEDGAPRRPLFRRHGADPAPLFERPQHFTRRPGFRRQLRHPGAPAVGEGFEHRPLVGGRSRRRHRALLGDPVSDRPRGGKPGGQDALQDFARRGEKPLRHFRGGFEELGRADRLVVEHFEHVAERDRFGVGVGGSVRDDDPGQDPFAEGHAHARPRQGHRERVRDPIGEAPADRKRQGDGDGAHEEAVRFQLSALSPEAPS